MHISLLLTVTVATSTPGDTSISRVCVNNTFSTINGSDPTCECEFNGYMFLVIAFNALINGWAQAIFIIMKYTSD